MQNCVYMQTQTICIHDTCAYTCTICICIYVCTSMYICMQICICPLIQPCIYIHIRHRALVARSGVIEGLLVQFCCGGLIDFKGAPPLGLRTSAYYTCIHSCDLCKPIFRYFLVSFGFLSHPGFQKPSKIHSQCNTI